MGKPLNRTDQVGARSPSHRILALANLDIAPHAGGQIDDDVVVLFPNALNHFPVKLNSARALACLRVANMAVDNGSTGVCGFESGIADLLRRYRNGWMSADSIAGAGHRAGDHNVRIHEILPGLGDTLVRQGLSHLSFSAKLLCFIVNPHLLSIREGRA
jgi:hypothetical protein